MAKRDPGDERCKDCSEPHEPEQARCAACAERHRKSAAARTKRRRKAGMCVTCGAKVAKRKRADEPGRYCAIHQAYYLARAT